MRSVRARAIFCPCVTRSGDPTRTPASALPGRHGSLQYPASRCSAPGPMDRRRRGRHQPATYVSLITTVLVASPRPPPICGNGNSTWVKSAAANWSASGVVLPLADRAMEAMCHDRTHAAQQSLYTGCSTAKQQPVLCCHRSAACMPKLRAACSRRGKAAFEAQLQPIFGGPGRNCAPSVSRPAPGTKFTSSLIPSGSSNSME